MARLGRCIATSRKALHVSLLVKELNQSILIDVGITGDMAAYREKAGGDVIHVCQQIYDTYHDNSMVKCRSAQKYCDSIVFASLHMDLGGLGLLGDEKKQYEHSGIHTSKTLDSIVEDFTNLWSTIHGVLSNIMISGRYHSDCMEPANQQVKKFDACLDRSLTLASYAKSKMHKKKVTWDGLLGSNRIPRDIAHPEYFAPHDTYLEICPDGDLEIGYYSVGTTFLVSSHALRTASSVFRDLLGPTSTFADSSLRDKTQDTLPGSTDNSTQRYRLVIHTVHNRTAVAVAFYALHGLGYKIPDEYAFSYLYGLAVVCEDYKCASIVLPFYRNWFDKWTIEQQRDGGWLYIAWVFGLEDIFQTLTKRFATGAFGEGNGRYVTLETEEDVKELGDNIPQMIVGMVTSYLTTPVKDII
jgi:hypothetical protein